MDQKIVELRQKVESQTQSTAMDSASDDIEKLQKHREETIQQLQKLQADIQVYSSKIHFKSTDLTTRSNLMRQFEKTWRLLK